MMNCIICTQPNLLEFKEFENLSRVTSDSKPFPKGGSLAVCQNCCSIQKIPNSKWLSEIQGIYENYELYYQSKSKSQMVYERGEPVLRCNLLSQYVQSFLGENNLDVGCGTGAFLDAISNLVSEESCLYGYDQSNKYLRFLQPIKGFKELFTNGLLDINKKFDFVSLIHTLEHIEDPVKILSNVRELLNDDGILFVQVPNVVDNPFDICVADHVSHFTPLTLKYLLAKSGYEISSLRTDIVKKEISVIAKKSATKIISDFPMQYVEYKNIIKKNIYYLDNLLSKAQVQNGMQFGIFGSSISAVWLASQIKDKVSFFVDEDLTRYGMKLLDYPILLPDLVPENSVVIVPLNKEICFSIAEKAKRLNWPFMLIFPED